MKATNKADGYFNKGCEALEYAHSHGKQAEVDDAIKCYQRAIKSFDKALLLDADFSQAKKEQALAHKGLEEMKRILSDYKKEMKEVKKDLQEAGKSMSQHQKDVKKYSKAIEAAPEDPKGYEQRGLAWAELGGCYRYKEILDQASTCYMNAIKDWDTAIELGYENLLTIYVNRATTKACLASCMSETTDLDDTLSQYTEALKDFSKALEISPEDVDTRLNRATLWNQLGELLFSQADKVGDNVDPEIIPGAGAHLHALEDLNIAIELAPKDSVLYSQRAATLMALIKVSEVEETEEKTSYYMMALENHNQAIKLDSTSAFPFFWRGTTLGKLADFLSEKGDNAEAHRYTKEAIKDLTQAIKLDKELCDAYQNRGAAWNTLGFLSEESGEGSKAISYYEKAIEDLKTVAKKNPASRNEMRESIEELQEVVDELRME